MDHQTSPLFTRDREEAKIRRPYLEIVDDSSRSLLERLSAYFTVIKPKYTRKTYRRGNEVPAGAFLSRLLECDKSNVSRLEKKRKLDIEHITILCYLAAILPGPAPGQTPREARQVRLEAAADWLQQKDEVGLTLLEWLGQKHDARMSA